MYKAIKCTKTILLLYVLTCFKKMWCKHNIHGNVRNCIKHNALHISYKLKHIYVMCYNL